MSDRRLRALEREAAASRDPEARARLLLARMRAGELERERVELAAYLGDLASLQALGGRPAALGIDAWVAGFERWEETTLVRAALAAARVPLLRWQERYEELRGSEWPCPQELLLKVEAWLACPCREHALAVYLGRQREGARLRGDPPLSEVELGALDRAAAEGDEVAALRALVERVRRGVVPPEEVALEAYLGDPLKREAQEVLRESECLPLALIANGLDPGIAPGGHFMIRSLQASCEGREEEELRAAVRAELVPWALGQEPLASRREASEGPA